jgi:ATP-binding cassette subfamily B protein
MVFAVMFIKLAGTMGELLIPYILEHLIDDVVPREKIGEVILWGLVMIMLALIVRQLNAKANRLSIKVAQKSAFQIRRELFWKSINLSGDQMDEFGLPSLTSRMTSDSYNLQRFIQAVQTLGIRAPILLIGGIAITLTMDVGLALILCIMAPLLILIVIFVSVKGIPLYDKVQKNIDEIVRIMRENIVGIRVVKSLSKEEYEKNHFGKANEKMKKSEVKASIITALPSPIMTLFLNVGLVLVVVFGAFRVNNGDTQPGVILAFLTYVNMVLMGVMALNRMFMLLSKANASANRIEGVVNKKDNLVPIKEEDACQTDREEYLIFEHVNFSYGQNTKGNSLDTEVYEQSKKIEDQCLEDINFALEKGNTLGIIGATGCGKTTILNLLMRFYDPDEGHIFLEGKDIRTYSKDHLHEKFGVVFQNDIIFVGSIRNNIAFGREVSMNDIIEASKNAGAEEFIEKYEDSYEHEAVIQGANFSGGQRQRILIARALVAHPEILILDDSSSALDYKTDAALRKSLRENYKDTTKIIVAQRISSIMNADDIIVLEEGKIIGYGTHEQLIKECEMYQHIFKTQMGEKK